MLKHAERKVLHVDLNFPRPPSENTFITRSQQVDKNDKTTDAWTNVKVKTERKNCKQCQKN